MQKYIKPDKIGKIIFKDQGKLIETNVFIMDDNVEVLINSNYGCSTNCTFCSLKTQDEAIPEPVIKNCLQKIANEYHKPVVQIEASEIKEAEITMKQWPVSDYQKICFRDLLYDVDGSHSWATKLRYAQKYARENEIGCGYADEDWEDFLGTIYSHLIKENFSNHLTSVLEIAPGYKWKIGAALAKVNFEGTVFVVETNEEYLEFLKKKYTELLPDAKIVFINDELNNAIKKLPSSIDLILSNHPLDDMLVYENNNDWHSLLNNEEVLNDVYEKVLKTWKHLINHVHFQGIILGQYSSNVFHKNDKVYEISAHFLNKLKCLFDCYNNFDIKEIIQRIEADSNYQHFSFKHNKSINKIAQNQDWLVGKIK